MRNGSFAATALILLTLAGCSNGGDKAQGATPSTTEKPTTTAATSGCSASQAEAARGLTVTDGKFDVTCAKVALGKQVFITNGGSKKVTVATVPGAPVEFNVELPKKTSTYAWTPKKVGTYTLTVTPGSGKVTVIVS